MMGKKQSKLGYMRQGQFFKIYHQMFESDAYRALSPVARCLLQELHSFYLPGKREEVFLSTRDGAKRIHAHPDTVGRAFHDLERLGFIVLVQGSLWQQKLSRKWRLTFEPYRGREPTDEWRAVEIPEPKRRGKLPQSEGQSNLIILARRMN